MTDKIVRDGFDIGEWEMIFPDGSNGLYSGTYSVVDGSQVEDVTADRIARVLAFQVEEGDCAETDLKLLVQLDDGSFAACMAGCDTTGWDCQAGVEWRWAPSEAQIVEQGIDRATRLALGRQLAIDTQTSGEIW